MFMRTDVAINVTTHMECFIGLLFVHLVIYFSLDDGNRWTFTIFFSQK